MGKPQKGRDPWGSETPSRSPWDTPSATKEKDKKGPKGSNEKKETNKKKPTTVKDLEKKAEKISSDPNVRAALAIRELKGSLPVKKQREGITALNQALGSILIKLAKKDVNIEKITSVKMLKVAVTQSNIKLNVPEATALENVDRVVGESGPTSTEISNDWPEVVTTAREASKGITTKAWEYWKENPGKGSLFAFAGIAGAYLSYQVIKNLVFGDEYTDKAKGKGPSWFKKEILIPLAVMLGCGALAGYLSKDQIAQIYAKYGLDFDDVKDKAANGTLTDDEKRRLDKAGKEVKDKADKARKQKEKDDGDSDKPDHEPASATAESNETSPEKLQEFGKNYLLRAGAKRKGETYQIKTGNTITHFKFADGKWKWASTDQMKKNEWVLCGTSPYDDKEKYAWVNSVSDRLAAGPRLSDAEKKHREFGQSLLEKADAKKQDDGDYLYITKYSGGETKTFFRFKDGEWEWASETQRNEDKWVLCGDSYYDEKERYKDVNGIAEKLWLDSANGTDEIWKGEDSKEKTGLSERLSSPETKFTAASVLFRSVFFFERTFKNKFKKNELKAVIETMREKKIKLSRIKEAVTKYHSTKRVPKSEFPEITQNLDDAELHMLMKKLVSFSKLAGQLEGDPDIETVFIKVAENPSYHASNLFHSGLIEKLKSGSIQNALGGLDYEKMNQDIIAKIKDGSLRIVDHINEKLNPDLKKHFEKLTEEEKEKATGIQGIMIAEMNINTPAQQAVERAIKESQINDMKPETKEFLIRFYTEVSEKTQKILPKAKQRYRIKQVNGVSVKDYMDSGIQFKKLSFLHCVEIIIAASEVDLDAKGEGEQYMQDMALLTILLRAMDPKDRQAYMTHLGTKLANEDVPEFDVPGLENLRPYFESIVDLGKELGTEYVLGYLTTAITFADARPKIVTEAFQEQLRNNPAITIGSEALGGGVEIGRDALALIFSTGGVEPEDFGNVKTGEDFLNLLMSNQNTEQIVYNRKNPAILAVQIAGKWIFMKPFGIMKESFGELSKFNPGTAVGTWVAGSAPFMAASGTKEFLTVVGRAGKTGVVHRNIIMKVGRVLMASLKGLKYPLYPIKLTKRGIEAAIRATQTTAEYGRSAQQAFNWTTDLVSKRTIAQNVGNMLESGHWMKHYAKDTKDLTDRTLKQTWRQLRGNKIDLLKRTFGSNFNRRMTLRYAIRFSKQYNSFFDFSDDSTRVLSVSALKEEKNIKAVIEKASAGYDRMRLFMAKANKNSAFMEELLAVTKKGLKGEALTDAMTDALRKLGHLDGDEVTALAHQLETEGDVQKFISRVNDGVAYANKMPKPSTGRLSIKERLRRSTNVEKARSFGKVKQALHQTERDLASLERRMETARKEIRLLNRMRKGPKFKGWDSKLQARLDTARKIIADGKTAQVEIKQSLQALKWVDEAEDALKAAKAAGNAAEVAKTATQLRAATELAEEAAAKSGKALAGVGKLGKAGSVLKYGGGLLAGAGTLFSAGMAVYSAHEALATDVEGRGKVKGAEAALWGVNAVADAAATAVIFGVEGTATTGLSALAAPLIPITYAGTVVTETLYEDTKQSYEWIQGDPYQVLHHFYTSVNTCSLGDAWLSGSHYESPDERMKIKRDTMRKIYRGLVAIQKDPGLLNYILTEESSKKKDKAVEERVTKNYSKYHEFFFQNMQPQGVNTYEDAKQFVLDAQMFDKIMTTRDTLKEAGKQFLLVGNDGQQFNLHMDRYDITGGVENPQPKVIYSPQQVVQAYKDGLIRLVESDEIVKENLNRMDTSYLVRLYVQIRLKLESPASQAEIKKEEGLAEFLSQQVNSLEGYLAAKRGVNLVFDATRPEYHQPLMSLKTIKEHITGLGSGNNKTYLDFEKNEYRMTPALHALYKLGQYFGYGGPPSEEYLKKFFNEAGAEFRGLYWNGEQWMLNERGYEWDDPMGKVLTNATIERFIARMREQPDNILVHRQDAIFLDAKDYKTETLGMAQILSDGLTEGKVRGYELSPIEQKRREELEKVSVVKNFNPKKIDYKQAKEELKKDYEAVIEYTKEKTGWSQLEAKVNNENSITLSRNDGGASVELTREGASWSVGGYKNGLSLVQAVALGNLKNWAAQWLEKEDIEGGSERPFEIDDDVIDFDEANTPVDTTFMEKWVGFYDHIGVSKTMAVEVLNEWYFNDIRKRQIDVGFFE